MGFPVWNVRGCEGEAALITFMCQGEEVMVRHWHLTWRYFRGFGLCCVKGRPLCCIPTRGFEAEGEDGNM
jgi:hypothetical protein